MSITENRGTQKAGFLIFCTLIIVLGTSGANSESHQSELIKRADVSIQMVGYGIYRAKRRNKIKADSSPTGIFWNTSSVKLVKKTANIPAKNGIRFGILYSISGEIKDKEVSIKRVFRFPGIRKPGSKKDIRKFEMSRIEKTRTIEGMFYKFDHDWEIVPGKWKFEIWYDGRKVIDQEFNVYPIKG